MPKHRTVIPGIFAERGQARLTARFVDEAGAAIPDTSFSTLTMKLYDKRSGDVINSHTATDILAGVDGNGNLVRVFTPDDMQIVDDVRRQEVHIALLRWTYSGGGEGSHEMEFTVSNMSGVTTP
jgi:hypothetical protein